MIAKPTRFVVTVLVGNQQHAETLELSAKHMADDLGPMVSDIDACRQFAGRCLGLIREDFAKPDVAPPTKKVKKPSKRVKVDDGK